MLNRNELYELLEAHPEYKKLLFCKGYLITSNTDIETPFGSLQMKHWKRELLGNYVIWHDERMPVYIDESSKRKIFLIGHAYSPFSMISDEGIILEKMASADSESDFWKLEAELTGIYVMGYVHENHITHWVDCTGMLPALYGMIDNHVYITSHAKLVGDLFNLNEDEYVTRLKNYKHFHYFGNILPGDITPFTELKRSVPNHKYTIYENNVTKERFFPRQKITNCDTEIEYQEVLNETALCMRNTMSLCADKWTGKKVAISITGGKDSGVTLASAKEQYDKYMYFSHDSSSEEHPDVVAAARICEGLEIKHEAYIIPTENSMYSDYAIIKDVMAYNGGNIIYNNDNDVRKRAFFLENNHFDVEIKSWVNEIGRARYYKRFNKKRFPSKPKAKYCTALYKPFFENRKLKRDTDIIFDKYINEYIKKDNLMPWLIQMYWEFSWSACEGMHMISEHMLAYDVTVPFNNRKLVELLLKPKLNDRINDRLQKDIIKINNSAISDMNVNVKDVNYSEKRAKAEKMYFNITHHFPF